MIDSISFQHIRRRLDLTPAHVRLSGFLAGVLNEVRGVRERLASSVLVSVIVLLVGVLDRTGWLVAVGGVLLVFTLGLMVVEELRHRNQ